LIGFAGDTRNDGSGVEGEDGRINGYFVRVENAGEGKRWKDRCGERRCEGIFVGAIM